MPKGQVTPLIGFNELEALEKQVKLTRRIARIVGCYDARVANGALRACMRPEVNPVEVGCCDKENPLRDPDAD